MSHLWRLEVFQRSVCVSAMRGLSRGLDYVSGAYVMQITMYLCR